MNTRLEINLKQIEDQQTEEVPDNFALYLSVAERRGVERSDPTRARDVPSAAGAQEPTG